MVHTKRVDGVLIGYGEPEPHQIHMSNVEEWAYEFDVPLAVMHVMYCQETAMIY